MDQDSQVGLFHEATAFYNSRQFEPCLNLLTKCISGNVTSMMLNNRGVVRYRLGNFSEARQDLLNSLQQDHLNFLAYFNLFSINTLNEQYCAAFDYLCLGLSSLNTAKCKIDRDIAFADQALYYCSNNKEAIMLKGLLFLEQKEYRKSLEMIRQALHWETKSAKRQEMLDLICIVSSMAGEKNTDSQIKFVGGPFQLKPSLSQPTPQQYETTVQAMLSEFNKLYCSLISEKSEIQAGEIEQPSSILLAHSDCTQKEDKNSNRVTANNSMVINDHESSVNEKQRNKGVSTIFLGETRESLSSAGKISEASVILEGESAISKDNRIKEQAIDKPKCLKQINFKVLYAQLAQGQHHELYAVIEYNKIQDSLFITSLTSQTNGYYQWHELSQPFHLTAQPSILTVKVYSKDYSRFNDELIGKGVLEVGQLGLATVPLYRGNCQRGLMNLIVALAE